MEGNVTPLEIDNTCNTSLFSCSTPFVNTISTPILRRSTQDNDTLTDIDITDKRSKINKILDVPIESEVTLPNSSPSTITFESPMAEPSICPCTTPIPDQIPNPILTRSPLSLNNSQTLSNESQLNTQGDLDKFKNLKDKHFNNPCVAYLNINSLRGDKFHELKEIIKPTLPEILCIDETKLTSDFKTAQFHIEGYQYPPFRRDRIQPISNRSFGGGKLVYIREGIICNRLEKYETQHAETISIELTFKNKKWFILFGYRPESINKTLFFEELYISLSKAANDYENIVVAGDLNIDLSIPNNDKGHFLSSICVTFDLKNLVNVKTCGMSNQGSSIDVILTNKPRSFYNTVAIETGLSDHHNIIATFLRCHYQRYYLS